MANKRSNKFWVRLTCLILVGLMVLGVATTAIFFIVNLLTPEDDDHKDHNHSAEAELPNYDELWTL